MITRGLWVQSGKAEFSTLFVDGFQVAPGSWLIRYWMPCLA